MKSKWKTPEIRRRKKRTSNSRRIVGSSKSIPDNSKTTKKQIRPKNNRSLKNIVLRVPDSRYEHYLSPYSRGKKKKRSRSNSRSKSKSNSKRKKRRRKSSRKMGKKRKSRSKRKKKKKKHPFQENSLSKQEIERFVEEKLQGFDNEEKDRRIKHLIEITNSVNFSDEEKQSFIDLIASPTKVQKINKNEIVINGETFISKKAFDELKQNTIQEVADRKRKLEEQLEEVKRRKREMREQEELEQEEEEREIESPYLKEKDRRIRLIDAYNGEMPKKKEEERLQIYPDYYEEDIGATYEDFNQARNTNRTQNTNRKRSKRRKMHSSKSGHLPNKRKNQTANEGNYNSMARNKNSGLQINFYQKYHVLTDYIAIIKDLKLPKINFAFRPKTLSLSKESHLTNSRQADGEDREDAGSQV